LTTKHQLLADASDGFMPRVLRYVAIVCVGKGLVQIASCTTQISIYKLNGIWGNSAIAWQQGLLILTSSLAVLLAAGGAGLWRLRAHGDGPF
jgi:hypothetical protein